MTMERLTHDLVARPNPPRAVYPRSYAFALKRLRHSCIVCETGKQKLFEHHVRDMRTAQNRFEGSAPLRGRRRNHHNIDVIRHGVEVDPKGKRFVVAADLRRPLLRQRPCRFDRLDDMDALHVPTDEQRLQVPAADVAAPDDDGDTCGHNHVPVAADRSTTTSYSSNSNIRPRWRDLKIRVSGPYDG